MAKKSRTIDDVYGEALPAMTTVALAMACGTPVNTPLDSIQKMGHLTPSSYHYALMFTHMRLVVEHATGGRMTLALGLVELYQNVQLESHDLRLVLVKRHLNPLAPWINRFMYDHRSMRAYVVFTRTGKLRQYVPPRDRPATRPPT